MRSTLPCKESLHQEQKLLERKEDKLSRKLLKEVEASMTATQKSLLCFLIFITIFNILEILPSILQIINIS